MSLKVSVKDTRQQSEQMGGVNLAKIDGKPVLITANHVLEKAKNSGATLTSKDVFVENGENGEKIKFGGFTQVGNRDVAVKELDDREMKNLETAGVNTDETYELPELDSPLPKVKFKTTANWKGGEEHEQSEHNLVGEKSGQFEIADPENKLGKGSSGGGLTDDGKILKGIMVTEKIDGPGKGNIQAINFANERVQEDLRKTLAVA